MKHHHSHHRESHHEGDAEAPRGPRFGGRGRPGGRRGGARRGDVRGAVLLLLSEEPMHGYQLMQEMAARTDGAWRPSPGAIYPALSQLEDEGLVLVTREGGRKLASLTDEGKAHVEEQRESIGDPFAELREAGDHGSLRNAMEQLAGAVHEVARTGSAAQRTTVEQALIEARRAVYLVLADVETPADPQV
jgi:DNA-binding PadR family transcriptional regulator